MPECIKAHLQQSRITKFFWGDLRIPAFLGGKKGREKRGWITGEGEREWKEMKGLKGKGKGQGKNNSLGRKGGATPNKNLPLHH